MKTTIHGQLTLEQLSEALQMAIAQMQDAGIEYVQGINLYYTPVDIDEREVTIWDDKLKKGRKVAREKFEVEIEEKIDLQ